MEPILHTFAHTLQTVLPQLEQISETSSAQFPAPGKWSKKQILGHLIDSASNNHQRFVRVQQTDGLHLPRYDQEFWVSAQNYQDESWRALLALWQSYNQHLLHVMANIPATKLTHTVRVGEGEAVTLRFLMEDYVHHLQQHLQQLLG